MTNSNGKLILSKKNPYAVVTCTKTDNNNLSCLPPTSVKSLPTELSSSPKLVTASYSPSGPISGGTIPPGGTTAPGGPTGTTGTSGGTGAPTSTSGGTTGPGGLTDSFKINMCP